MILRLLQVDFRLCNQLCEGVVLLLHFLGQIKGFDRNQYIFNVKCQQRLRSKFDEQGCQINLYFISHQPHQIIFFYWKNYLKQRKIFKLFLIYLIRNQQQLKKQIVQCFLSVNFSKLLCDTFQSSFYGQISAYLQIIGEDPISFILENYQVEVIIPKLQPIVNSYSQSTLAQPYLEKYISSHHPIQKNSYNLLFSMRRQLSQNMEHLKYDLNNQHYQVFSKYTKEFDTYYRSETGRQMSQSYAQFFKALLKRIECQINLTTNVKCEQFDSAQQLPAPQQRTDLSTNVYLQEETDTYQDYFLMSLESLEQKKEFQIILPSILSPQNYHKIFQLQQIIAYLSQVVSSKDIEDLNTFIRDYIRSQAKKAKQLGEILKMEHVIDKMMEMLRNRDTIINSCFSVLSKYLVGIYQEEMRILNSGISSI